MTRRVAWAAITAAVLGVFLPWTSDGPIRLDGTEGPHNGWLVVIVAVFAIAWARSMHGGSWVGVVGVLGAAAVIVWTALESWLGSRDVSGASPAVGLVLVVAAGVALAGTAVAHAAELVRRRGAASPRADDERARGHSVGSPPE